MKKKKHDIYSDLKKEEFGSIEEEQKLNKKTEDNQIDPRDTVDTAVEKIMILKNASVNVGEIYNLIKGKELPKEIDKKFYNSLKTMEVI